MARRTYRRSSATSDTLATLFGTLAYRQWPVIVQHEVAEHTSILSPRITALEGMCGPADVRAILLPSSPPAIRTLLNYLQPWNGPPPRLSSELPHPPGPKPIAPMEPIRPNLEDYVPAAGAQSFVDKFGRKLFGEDGATLEERKRFFADTASWHEALRDYEGDMQKYERSLASWTSDEAEFTTRKEWLRKALADAGASYREQCETRDAAIGADSSELERLLENASDGEPGAIAALAKQVWLSIPLPADFPREIGVEFDEDTGVMLLTIEAPDFERVPLTLPQKTSRKAVGDRVRRTTQQTAHHTLPLRLAHEIFATDELEAIRLVGVNVRLSYIDRRDGRSRHGVVASMVATREEFEQLNIAEVDPKLCFRSLKGRETPSYDEISQVKPLLSFDRDDRRIVEGREIVDQLNTATNLAAMDWEDFEHVVRELFAKMFAVRSPGAEVHVTRASRDYGVDALVYDPDPIMGGKYVIQAKRYVNTVEVSAVRDLFGTVQNEGASKGFLVTTSAFGPDAHQFAKGKPLTLIDGPHLLSLLEAQGYKFRVDLAEARRVLHGK